MAGYLSVLCKVEDDDMTGILEQMLQQLVTQKLQEIIPHIVQEAAKLVHGGGHNQAQGLVSQGTQLAEPAQNYAAVNQTVDPFGGVGTIQQPQTQQVQATPEMIQQLIIPMVQNEQQKVALTAEMQAMGIASLNDVRPDQLNDLYARFIAVRDKFAGGQQQAAAQTQPSGGII